MDSAKIEAIRESYPNNIRTRTIAEAENIEFNRIQGLGPEERKERMDIEGALAGLAFDTGIDYGQPENRHMLITLADKFGTHAEERRKLESETYTDSLTGLRNRKAFNQALEHTKSRDDLRYIFMDMDNFGRINKIKGLGWDVGNKALENTADHLRAVANVYDVAERDIFHIHGDEFAMIVPSELADDMLADIEGKYGSEGLGEEVYESEYGRAVTGITGVSVEAWEEAADALNEKKAFKKASV